ncbi:hypothetical protein BOTBODRAFT_180502 [Botryobasidium botryosum FD-172 SS1]|uniref:Uncharacterized protein n=1 Tax=Botryobasidium botryosum (strain FD-172 SS1) TaxID=930990 RepID=A0A067M6X1_BOTB1|nr:hypothetical protein BOTBODRAFT_180502 [Botryobasidium botryosum FD-172 SS1]
MHSIREKKVLETKDRGPFIAKLQKDVARSFAQPTISHGLPSSPKVSAIWRATKNSIFTFLSIAGSKRGPSRSPSPAGPVKRPRQELFLPITPIENHFEVETSLEDFVVDFGGAPDIPLIDFGTARVNEVNERSQEASQSVLLDRMANRVRGAVEQGMAEVLEYCVADSVRQAIGRVVADARLRGEVEGRVMQGLRNLELERGRAGGTERRDPGKQFQEAMCAVVQSLLAINLEPKDMLQIRSRGKRGKQRIFACFM